MIKNLNISYAQLNPTIGDLEYNAGLIKKAVIGVGPDCDLLILPEMVVSGYPTEDLVLHPDFQDAVHRVVEEELAPLTSDGVAILLGSPWVIENKLYNAALLLAEGKIKGVVCKHHLPNYGVFDEDRVFVRGELPKPLELKGTSLGVMVCEDLWEDNVSSHLKEQGADLLIVINGSPYEVEKQDYRVGLAKKHVMRTELPLVYVNQLGGQDSLVFDGASFAMNEKGELISALSAWEEGTSALEDKVSSWPEEIENFYRGCVIGLRDYVRKNKFQGVAVGLSSHLQTDSFLIHSPYLPLQI